MGSLFAEFNNEILVPEVAENITLRPYQEEAVTAANAEWESGVRSTVIVLPTGCGKSIVYSETMRRLRGDRRVLILAHRAELIYQAVAHAKNAGLESEIEMAERRSKGLAPVVISTVQTQVSEGKCQSCFGIGCVRCGQVGRCRRMQMFDPHEFGLVIIDEAHHCTAETYRLVMDWYSQNPDLKFLGVTATPNRTDKSGLHNVFDSVAYQMDIQPAIEQGWLVPIRQKFVTVDWLDLSKVKKKAGGDLADGELQRAFLGDSDNDEDLPKDVEARLHEIAFPTLEIAGGKPVLVFASGVRHAKLLCRAFNSYDGVEAELVVGVTDKKERAAIIERYKSGETQVLVGCGVFTEGFDAPDTFVVAIARPTNSTLLYTQMIGRGTRPERGVVDGPDTAELRREAIANSGKPHCVVIDFVGNSGKHKLVSVMDVLAGKDVDPVDLAAALELAQASKDAVDVEALIEKVKQAREEKEERLRKEAEEKKAAATTRQRATTGKYSAVDVDPFSGANFNTNAYNPVSTRKSSKKQINFLVMLGVGREDAADYSVREASNAIKERKSRCGGEYRVCLNKHSGKKLSDCPQGYIDWIKRKFDPIHEIHRHIELMEREAEMVRA